MKKKFNNIMNENPIYGYILYYASQGMNIYEISHKIGRDYKPIRKNIKKLVEYGIIKIDRENKPTNKKDNSPYKIIFLKEYEPDINKYIKNIKFHEIVFNDLIKNKEDRELVKNILKYILKNNKVYYQDLDDKFLDNGKINSKYIFLKRLFQRLNFISEKNNFFELTKLGKLLLKQF